MKKTDYQKKIDWIAQEVSLALAGAYIRGDLKLPIFPDDKRPDYDCARKIAKYLGLKETK